MYGLCVNGANTHTHKKDYFAFEFNCTDGSSYVFVYGARCTVTVKLCTCYSRTHRTKWMELNAKSYINEVPHSPAFFFVGSRRACVNLIYACQCAPLSNSLRTSSNLSSQQESSTQHIRSIHSLNWADGIVIEYLLRIIHHHHDRYFIPV